MRVIISRSILYFHTWLNQLSQLCQDHTQPLIDWNQSLTFFTPDSNQLISRHLPSDYFLPATRSPRSPNVSPCVCLSVFETCWLSKTLACGAKETQTEVNRTSLYDIMSQNKTTKFLVQVTDCVAGYAGGGQRRPIKKIALVLSFYNFTPKNIRWWERP